jgi:prepilin-type N-terminal cleavage/methylation domain-containing protein
MRRATRPAVRSAFTLLEVMLALALSSIVALSAYGLFEVIRRSERRQFIRMGETDEIARTYKAMERTFKSLVMSDAPIPGDEKAMQERMREFERRVDNGDPDPELERDEPEPRLILRSDPMSPMLEAITESGPTRMKAQILEVALRSPPVLGGRPDTRLFDRALEATSGERALRDLERRQRDSDRRERSEADDDESAETEDEEPPQLAPGVRGVFELVPDGVDPLGALGPNAGLEGWKPRQASAPGWTLWWRELPPPPPEEEDEDADPDAPRRSIEAAESDQLIRLAAARRVPLMTGLRWLRWEVYRGKRFDSRTRATWITELPGFVKVTFETVEGRRENWMFEVTWTTGPEPGTEIASSGLPGRTPPISDPRSNTRGGTGTDRRDRPAAVRGRNNNPNTSEGPK